MRLRLRRSLVAGGVAGSILLGLVSIRVAARLAEAAGPPTAPPISMSELTRRLQEEEARAASLQGQLVDLLGVTDQLRAALAGTADQVSTDGLSADQLRERLQAAEATLAKVTALLEDARRRLAALGAGGGGGGGGGGSGGGGGAAGTSGPATTPGAPGGTPTPVATQPAFSLALSLVSGDVQASWTVCGSTPFDSYALVRSSISEVHWPPETGNTQVARITSATTTSATDAGAPSGRSWYRLYCLVRVDNEVKIAKSSQMLSITVP